MNHPLTVDGTKVFLLGHGYAPVFTVRDGERRGRVLGAGAVPAAGRRTSPRPASSRCPTPRRSSSASRASSCRPRHSTRTRGPISVFPDAQPARSCSPSAPATSASTTARPQSVYPLDTREMTQVTRHERPVPSCSRWLRGDADAAGRLGSRSPSTGPASGRSFQVSPTTRAVGPALGAAVLALIGLMLSLFVRRRRVWVRALPGDDGRTVVEVAGLAAHRARGVGEGLSRRGRGAADAEETARAAHEALAQLSNNLLLRRDGRLRRCDARATRPSWRSRSPRRASGRRAAWPSCASWPPCAAGGSRRCRYAGRRDIRRGASVAGRRTGARGAGRPARPVAVSLTVLGFALHLGAVVTRGVSRRAGRRGATCTSSRSIGGARGRPGSSSSCSPARRRPLARRLRRAPVLLTLGLAVTVLYTEAAPLVPGAAVVLARHPRARGDHRRRRRSRVGALQSLLYLVQDRARTRAGGSRASLVAGCRPAGAGPGRRTGCTRSPSRSGRSRSSPARSGPSTPGAATGAGTPRRPGRSSPGWSTRRTCTPGRPPAGRAAGRRDRAGRLRDVPVQLLRGEHLAHRPPLVRRGRLSHRAVSAPAGARRPRAGAAGSGRAGSPGRRRVPSCGGPGRPAGRRRAA